MGIFDGVSLTNKEKAERGLSLPEKMSIYDIAHLWSDDKRDIEIYMEAMHSAFKNGLLAGEEYIEDPYWDNLPTINPYQLYIDVEVNRSDFNSWLTENGEVLPEDCLLTSWVPGRIASDQGNSHEVGRRQKQINKILAVIESFQFDPLQIPYGGKQEIKTECLKDKSLFTEDGFKKAWMEANKKELIRLINKEKFLSNQS